MPTIHSILHFFPPFKPFSSDSSSPLSISCTLTHNQVTVHTYFFLLFSSSFTYSPPPFLPFISSVSYLLIFTRPCLLLSLPCAPPLPSLLPLKTSCLPSLRLSLFPLPYPLPLYSFLLSINHFQFIFNPFLFLGHFLPLHFHIFVPPSSCVSLNSSYSYSFSVYPIPPFLSFTPPSFPYIPFSLYPFFLLSLYSLHSFSFSSSSPSSPIFPPFLSFTTINIPSFPSFLLPLPYIPSFPSPSLPPPLPLYSLFSFTLSSSSPFAIFPPFLHPLFLLPFFPYIPSFPLPSHPPPLLPLYSLLSFTLPFFPYIPPYPSPSLSPPYFPTFPPFLHLSPLPSPYIPSFSSSLPSPYIPFLHPLFLLPSFPYIPSFPSPSLPPPLLPLYSLLSFTFSSSSPPSSHHASVRASQFFICILAGVEGARGRPWEKCASGSGIRR
ncbi:hypothetical protein C7M84_022846 [Penaeus vannamei]|uniref:Uncharacterized protein n=1 Tax=Penaeus vannamei TaxID=6689 RepID=A0A423U5M8_PENVA|nr:hypothetical protein C7M84_022846 [Penaeus vannamei]